MSDFTDYSSDGSEEFQRAPRVFQQRPNPLREMSDEQFRMRFRLRKDVVENLEMTLRESLQPTTRRNMALSPMCMVLLTLRFFATGSFQIVISDLFKIDKATACRAIHKVTAKIAALRQQYIRMPNNRGERRWAMRKFYEIANFPCVLGAIDCTHIPIKSPGGDNAEIFRNRHGWFSLNVQAICNSDLSFCIVVSRWPGSSHDSNVFRNSRVHAQFEAGEFPEGVLLGDSGYFCCHYLLTPVVHETTPAHRAYNKAHRKTRSAIERAFGVLKRRFPCLSLGLRVNLDRIPPIIVATFVLHNIALNVGDDVPEIDDHLIAERPVFAELPEPIREQGDRRENTAVRTALITNKFS